VHTLTISKQVTRDRALYTKNRLQIPLPKETPCKSYKVILDDQGRWGVLYGEGTSPWNAHAGLLSVSPVSAGLGAVIGLLDAHHIEAKYLGITGSVAVNEYNSELSDIDMAVVVDDQDAGKLRQLARGLPSNIDLVICEESFTRNPTHGIERQILLYSRPLLDTIDLKARMQESHLDCDALRTHLDVELNLLESLGNLISISGDKDWRYMCLPHLLTRLRGIHMIHTALLDIPPTKASLADCLSAYGISRRLVKQLYTLSRFREHAISARHLAIMNETTIRRLWNAVREYGQVVKREIDSFEKTHHAA